MKKSIIYGLVTSLLLIITYCLFYFQPWTFLTGTHAPAFLGTIFEMSLQDARRSLKKNDVELLDRNTFAKLAPSIEKNIPRNLLEGSLFTEDKIYHQTSWYTPPVSMFDSEVASEFIFIKNRLTKVEVRIFPLSDPKLVIEKIINKLKQKYTFIKKNMVQNG